jgi:hypothetical protein
MCARLLEWRDKNRSSGEYISQSPRYIFEIDRHSNTPFITVVQPEEFREATIKIKPKPSNLFGYIDID